MYVPNLLYLSGRIMLLKSGKNKTQKKQTRETTLTQPTHMAHESIYRPTIDSSYRAQDLLEGGGGGEGARNDKMNK